MTTNKAPESMGLMDVELGSEAKSAINAVMRNGAEISVDDLTSSRVGCYELIVRWPGGIEPEQEMVEVLERAGFWPRVENIGRKQIFWWRLPVRRKLTDDPFSNKPKKRR